MRRTRLNKEHDVSTYIAVEGKLKFAKRESYDDAVATLRGGHWLDEEDRMIAGSGDPVDADEPCLDPDALTIEIPWGFYRNLGNVLDPLCNGADSGTVFYTCTDGMETVGLLRVEKGVVYDWELEMVEWARRNNLGMDGAEYVPSDDMKEDTRRLDAHAQWADSVEVNFMDIPWHEKTLKELRCELSSP